MILVKKAFSNQILTEHGTRNMKPIVIFQSRIIYKSHRIYIHTYFQ